jgi:hypothetical protein
MNTSKHNAPRLPDHERIREDAHLHPERSCREHIEAARDICGETYRDDLARISPAANAALSCELEAEDLGL